MDWVDSVANRMEEDHGMECRFSVVLPLEGGDLDGVVEGELCRGEGVGYSFSYVWDEDEKDGLGYTDLEIGAIQ